MDRRRFFLKMMEAAAVVFSWPAAAMAYFIPTLGTRTVEIGNFLFRDGMIVSENGRKNTPYRLVVEGLVKNSFQLSYNDLAVLPQTKQTSDFHCVEGWSVQDIAWEGIRFAEIVRRAEPLPDARHVIFHALGKTDHVPQRQEHYIECLSVAHLLDAGKNCLLALRMNGELLSHDHGAPLRVIVPDSYGYKNIKYVYKIEFSAVAVSGWWTLANPLYTRDASVPANRLREK